jgi:hypothetical protein
MGAAMFTTRAPAAARTSGMQKTSAAKQASVLTFDTFQQRTAVKATTARGQVVANHAFLAERLVFLAGLGR